MYFLSQIFSESGRYYCICPPNKRYFIQQLRGGGLNNLNLAYRQILKLTIVKILSTIKKPPPINPST